MLFRSAAVHRVGEKPDRAYEPVWDCSASLNSAPLQKTQAKRGSFIICRSTKKLKSGVQLPVFYEALHGVLQKTLEAGVGWKLPTTATSKWIPLRFSPLNQSNRFFPPNISFLKLELDGSQTFSLIVLQLLNKTAPK